MEMNNEQQIGLSNTAYDALASGEGWTSYQKDSAAPRHRQRIIHSLLKQIPPFTTVADVGCGRGVLIERLLRSVSATFTGYDVSEHAVAANTAAMPHCRFAALDLMTGPVPEAYDVVICSEVLEHLQDWRIGLQNLVPAVERDLIITVPSGPIRRTDLAVGHIKHFDGSELRAALDELGFDTVRCFKWGFPFHTLYKRLINGTLSERLQARFLDRKPGPGGQFVNQALYLLFFLNLNRGGRQLILHARRRPAGA